MSGKLWRKTSSFDLKIVKVLRDLMFGGTTLYSADAFEVNELNLMVFTLLYLELPSGLRHVVPCPAGPGTHVTGVPVPYLSQS